MIMNQTSFPESQHEDLQVAMALRDQEEIEKREENFIVQVAARAREEWETFHLEHPDIDEETFRQAQRFCVKQWFLQEGALLSDLPAFERAKKHFEFEVKGRAAEIQEQVTTAMMTGLIYQEAQSLGVHIATQARQRSKRAHEALEELSSDRAPYLMGKIQKLRASGQAQEREKESQERVQRARQDIEDMKRLGIAIEYEKQK